MKRLMLTVMSFLLFLVLAACGGRRELVDMEQIEAEGRSAIIWEGRTYEPFCVISKNDCGEQLGYINGDAEDKVSAYQDHAPEEWIVNWLSMDGGAILYKEENVADIPAGLKAEYD